MGHGIGLHGQIVEGLGDAAGDVNKGQVGQLARGGPEAISNLGRQLEHQIGIVTAHLVKPFVADTRHFRGHPGHQIRRANFFSKQPHFTKEITRVQVADYHFLVRVLIIVDDDGDRALKHKVKRVTGFALLEDGLPLLEGQSFTVAEKALGFWDSSQNFSLHDRFLNGLTRCRLVSPTA